MSASQAVQDSADSSPATAADSNLRFRTLFEQAPFSMQLLAANGRTVQVNKAWEALWGAEHVPAIKDYVLHGDYNILTDAQLEAKGILPHLRRAFSGESVALPVIYYDPGELGMPGHARWLKAWAHPIKDAGGMVQEVMLVHQDVTEQVESENELRASELRFKQLANSIPQLAWIADERGYRKWYNDRWCEYTGLTAEQSEGFGWHQAHDPLILPEVMKRWEHSLTTGESFEMTFPLRGKDGVYRPFYTLVAPFKEANGKIRQWFGTNTDVSAFQQAQHELHQAEERLRVATEAGNIGIWEWDIANDRIIWSDRVYALHGLDPRQFTIDMNSFSSVIHPDDSAGLWQKIGVALQETGSFSAEFRTVWPDGSVRWLSTWAKLERDHQGKPARMIGATISIDAHKKAEEALRESNRRKDEFLAMLAHELRNPLAPISAASEILRLPSIDERHIRQTSEVLSRQVGHMTKLIDELMDVSRVTRGLVKLERENLDLKALVHHAVEQVRSLIEARHHVLRTRMDADHIRIDGDRTRLVQILSNLLNNAAKYTPMRGEIGLDVQVVNGCVRITVSDNGQGIEPALLPYVFDLFTQGKRELDRSQGGLGIGLALVRSIVLLHEGTVEAQSAGIGKGSVFTITLPLADASEVMQIVPEQGLPVAPDAMRIVIVDDNLDAANSMALLLQAGGHQVTVFENATRALNEAAAFSPRVFLLDIGLPDMTGYELAKRLRRQSALQNTVLIALTGYGQDNDREQAFQAGFDHHFVKPADTQKLFAILAQARSAKSGTALADLL
jgi:PAS domain S-box-containing protein